MRAAYLDTVSLEAFSLDTLPLLRQLKSQYQSARPEICIERARFITGYLRDKSSGNDPIEIRYSSAVNHFLTNKAPRIHDNNLLAGSTTSKIYGAPTYPEFTALTIWPE
ncbi:MAG: pyruvate formate lyase family protein, partial [Nitrospinota bacterium]